MKKQKTRCPWVNLEKPMYVAYHDQEWGKPVYDDLKHFEMLTLEGAQAGLSWETILNKRENYRKCFAGFDPHKIAKFTPKKQAALLTEPGIVRNRLKIASTITNAKAFLKIQKEFGSFDKYIWAFVKGKPIIQMAKNIADYPTKTALSDAISKDLKKRGFRFVGSTIIYAYMQAIGMVNDHALECYLSKKKIEQQWHIYIIACKDKSFYTGIALNVQQRFAEHQAQGKKTAKYLRGKGPFQLVFHQKIGDKSKALKMELWLKSLSKKQKEEIVKRKSLIYPVMMNCFSF